MANSFAITRSSKNGLLGPVVVLTLNGFLDAHTAPEFEKTIQGEYDGGQIRLIAECSGLTYISSAGLGVFMSFIEEIRSQGGDLKICGLSPKVAQVFEILGFASIFDIVPGVEEAAALFESAAKEG